MLKQLVSALVLSRIDYCNVALAGLPTISLAPLQGVINAAARFVANLRPRDHVSHVLYAIYIGSQSVSEYHTRCAS